MSIFDTIANDFPAIVANAEKAEAGVHPDQQPEKASTTDAPEIGLKISLAVKSVENCVLPESHGASLRYVVHPKWDAKSPEELAGDKHYRWIYDQAQRRNKEVLAMRRARAKDIVTAFAALYPVAFPLADDPTDIMGSDTDNFEILMTEAAEFSVQSLNFDDIFEMMEFSLTHRNPQIVFELLYKHLGNFIRKTLKVKGREMRMIEAAMENAWDVISRNNMVNVLPGFIHMNNDRLPAYTAVAKEEAAPESKGVLSAMSTADNHSDKPRTMPNKERSEDDPLPDPGYKFTDGHGGKGVFSVIHEDPKGESVVDMAAAATQPVAVKESSNLLPVGIPVIMDAGYVVAVAVERSMRVAGFDSVCVEITPVPEDEVGDWHIDVRNINTLTQKDILERDATFKAEVLSCLSQLPQNEEFSSIQITASTQEFFDCTIHYGTGVFQFYIPKPQLAEYLVRRDDFKGDAEMLMPAQNPDTELDILKIHQDVKSAAHVAFKAMEKFDIQAVTVSVNSMVGSALYVTLHDMVTAESMNRIGRIVEVEKLILEALRAAPYINAFEYVLTMSAVFPGITTAVLHLGNREFKMEFAGYGSDSIKS